MNAHDTDTRTSGEIRNEHPAPRQQADRVTIVAEVGSNYDDDLELAKHYVRAAKEAGADAVKFQTLRRAELFSRRVLVQGKWEDNPVLPACTNLELPDDWHYALREEADRAGIQFISTPFYLEAVDLLERVAVPYYKVASGDLTFYPLLERIGRTGKPVVLSTGGSTLEEVRTSVRTLREAGSGRVTVLHCVAKYPPRFDEMNLRAIATLRRELELPVGISDHSPGDLVPLASVALGATFIEKHVTFDRSRSGPDHGFAMLVQEFAEMVSRVRTLELALGDGIKRPPPDEEARRHRFRRCPYDRETHLPTEAADADAVWLRPDPRIRPWG